MALHKEPPKHYLGHIVKGKMPIIIIPGIAGKWSFMKNLGDCISHLGHPVYIVPRLRYNFFNIPTSAKIVRELIDSFFKSNASTSPGIILIGHSKGGLIGKYLLAFHNNDRIIKGLVTISTPFSGSNSAKLVPHKSFKELHTSSKIIRELEAIKNINKQIISVIPEFDNHIWAEKGSFLDGAFENIKVNIKGHHKILFSKEVHAKVIESIEKLSTNY